MAKANAGIRVDAPLLARLDVIAQALSNRAEGTEITRSDAARTALGIGVDELEKRLGIVDAAGTSKATKKGAKPKT